MSIDNSELLMLLGGKKSKSTIGKAGQKGFGVGVYGGDPADLTAMGLAPMEGCENPSSDNYGNYVHTNGSVMVFIPAFAIRIGNASAPLYSKYGADTIEIGGVELDGKDGWAIPRGFYDGGKLHSGFFIDKYLCSKDTTGKLAVSVKNKDPISLYAYGEPSSSMPDCEGVIHDAITLGRARGEHYALVSCYQWAVISLVSLAHAQNATSVESCAWYDADGYYNYPKGNNAFSSSPIKDVDDTSIEFTNSSYNAPQSKTGSAVPLAKTTHNGQLNGICDVNGNSEQLVLGWTMVGSDRISVAKLSVKMHDFTKNNRVNTSLFDDYLITPFETGSNYWKSPALYATDDPQFPLCGVMPKTSINNPPGTFAFGKDAFYMGDTYYDTGFAVGGGYNLETDAGVWRRRTSVSWKDGGYVYGFRAAGYPP